MPPKPTPTATLALRGSWRAKVRKGEPVPDPTEIVAPDYLSEAALGQWDRLAPLLSARGVLTSWDTTHLAVFCANLARLAEAERHLTEFGAVIVNSVGQPSPSPWLSIARNCEKAIHTFGGCLGLSPADRTRIRIPPAATDGGKADKYFRHLG